MSEHFYARHLLHLASFDEGQMDTRIECVDPDTCEYQSGPGTHPDGPMDEFCAFADWLDNVGNELILDWSNPAKPEIETFPENPSFPIPVKPHDWDDDGLRVVFDPRPKEPF